MTDYRPAQRQTRLATATAIEMGASSNSRAIPYIFSNSDIATDGHRIMTAGWKLDTYRTNPVVLWAHDDTMAPIARTVEVGIVGDDLRGIIEYADPADIGDTDHAKFADMVFRMVKGGFLSAVSVSWMPIEWKFATERDRQGGIDFLQQSLLEVSQVPVPALGAALATARNAGINTQALVTWAEKVLDSGVSIAVPRNEIEQLRRIAQMPKPLRRADGEEWKCGAARDLPINTEKAWDAAEAEKAIFADAGFDGDSPDTSKARQAFLAYDASAPEKKGSYKLPFADLIDGKLTAIKAAIDNAAARLSGTGIPDDIKTEAQGVIDTYQKKAGEGDDKERAVKLKRGLYECGYLSMVLCDLQWIMECCEWETAAEGDNSPIGDRLKATMADVGQILIDMTKEEVGELLGNPVTYDDEDMAQDPRAAASALARRLDAPGAAAIAAAIRSHLRGERVTIKTERAALPLKRAGRVLSADNEQCLRDAHAAIMGGCDMVRGVFEKVDPEDEDEDDDENRGAAMTPGETEETERAARERRARLAAAKKRVAGLSVVE